MYRIEIWRQWDYQDARRRRTLELLDQLVHYKDLNNLYLQIERGEVPLTITTANELRVLASKAYDKDDPMIDWWKEQFLKLEGWNDV